MIHQTHIPGIGVVGVDDGGLMVKVGANGQQGTKVGRTSWTVPTESGGTAEVRLKPNLFDVYPSLVVGDTEYRTGPTPDMATRILLFTPIVVLLFVQGLIGFGVAAVGILVNRSLVVRMAPGALRALAMLGVTVGSVVVAIGALNLFSSLVGG